MVADTNFEQFIVIGLVSVLVVISHEFACYLSVARNVYMSCRRFCDYVLFEEKGIFLFYAYSEKVIVCSEGMYDMW